jgi:hypothetical protein
MKSIKIEEVGDINSDFSYLEVFYSNSESRFLEIGISEDRELSFKFYKLKSDIVIGLEDWEYILSTAKSFLPKALKNEDDFLNFSDQYE